MRDGTPRSIEARKLTNDVDKADESMFKEGFSQALDLAASNNLGVPEGIVGRPRENSDHNLSNRRKSEGNSSANRQREGSV